MEVFQQFLYAGLLLPWRQNRCPQVTEVIGPEGVPQGDAAGAPAGDGCVAAPVAAGASAFQVDASAERGAGESVGEYGVSALGTAVLE